MGQKNSWLQQRNFLPGILIFVVGIGGGILISHATSLGEQKQAQTIRENSSGYQFINPILFNLGGQESSGSEYGPLKRIINNYADEATASGSVTDISIYFRNLNAAEWISFNENKTFSPASMLKVVTLIAIMRDAEADPDLLEKQIKIVGDDSALIESQQRYPIQDPIRSGRSYSIDTLTQHLIIDSDNVANATLINSLGENKIFKIYKDMRLHTPSENAEGYTAEEYSHLFRALYNSTYLSRSASEKVLNLLSQTTFDHGLVAGVPKDITVSHKFGIKTNKSPSIDPKSTIVESRELHDCGIVYYPKNPYFLCIMTRGSDFDDLEKTIQNLSKIVWDYFDKKLGN